MKQAELCNDGNRGISPEQVRAYLANHPDFFTGHEELLEILSLPHPSGSAVSLIERQLAKVREKNKILEQQLDNLVQIARDNDQLFQKLHRLTLALMDAGDLESAIAGLQSVLYDQFKADFVSVRIFQNHRTSALAELFVPVEDGRLASFRKIVDSGQPKCGQPSPEHAEFLFGDNADLIRSCAIIPFFAANVIGLLGIGSHNAKRFSPTMGHLFLSRIGEILGYRLDSMLGDPD
ncbi:MAG: DUF484 family protein [Methylococcales bacterium]